VAVTGDTADTRRGSVARVLSIAGSDPSGGAGIQADLKAFAAVGAYGMAAVTALTAQNTRGVAAVSIVEPDFLRRQIDEVFHDIAVDAVKIGMIGNPASVGIVAAALARHQPAEVVVDPVMVAKSGDRLVSDETVAAMRDELLPRATLVTPNLPEAGVLLGRGAPGGEADMPAVAASLARLLGGDVLLKGGHLRGERSRDLLVAAGESRWLDARRVVTDNTHGTGCTLSSAIAALLPVAPSRAVAIRAAKAYLTGCLEGADDLAAGEGHGPVHHFHRLWREDPAAALFAALD